MASTEQALIPEHTIAAPGTRAGAGTVAPAPCVFLPVPPGQSWMITPVLKHEDCVWPSTELPLPQPSFSFSTPLM